jgi:hypothetical protein
MERKRRACLLSLGVGAGGLRLERYLLPLLVRHESDTLRQQVNINKKR